MKFSPPQRQRQADLMDKSLLRRTAFGGTLSLAMAASFFLAFAFGSLAPFIRGGLHLSRTQLGSLTTVLYAVGGLLSPLTGHLVDTLGGRRVLSWLFVTASVGLVGTAVAPSYAWLLAAASVAGLAAAASNPTTNKLVAVNVLRAGPGVLTGVKQSGVQVGAFLAGIALPAGAAVMGWRHVLLASAALPIGGILATHWFVPTDESPAYRQSRAGHDRGPLPRTIWWLVGYAFLMGLGNAALMAYLPLYAHEGLGLSPEAAGLTAAIAGLVGIAGRVGWGRAGDMVEHSSLLLAVLGAGSVVAQGLVWLAEGAGAWVVWIGVVFAGATIASWNSVGMLAIIKGFDVSQTARASGLVLLAFYIGYVPSPIAFGYGVDTTGAYDLAWGGVICCYVAATAVATGWYLLRREGPRGKLGRGAARRRGIEVANR
jgi:predicted MFS family arabinose efflux permease